jgi:glycosyltransferase involved in cell wall biosynthesis
MDNFTIIIPIYNGFSTLGEVFSNLDNQQNKELINEIILINDNSNDGSGLLIRDFKKRTSYKVREINHERSIGLAGGYNEGIRLSKTKYIILMHQDILLPNKNSFEILYNLFAADINLLAAFPIILHPENVWHTYSFWQKCLFSRFVGKESRMLTGKFDAFNRNLLLRHIGFFDNISYRTAGEDSDLKERAKRFSCLHIICSEIKIIHVHNKEKVFPLKKWIKKESQLAEAQGVILRKYGITSIKGFILSFFRQLLLVSLLIPYIQIIGSVMILLYSVLYTQKVYKKARDVRIIVLPFVNILLLLVALTYSCKGFITQKQRI